MTDNQKTIFLKKVLSGDEILHMKMKYDFFVFLPFYLDLFMSLTQNPNVFFFFLCVFCFFPLRALEETQQLEVEKALVLTNQGSVMWRQEKPSRFTRGQVISEDLSQNVVAVCGVVLPRTAPRKPEQVNQKDVVLVDSTCRNLRRLALAVASQKPVLLEGPIGCGKTALVEFMAAVTGHTKATEILKVQLGDQTDSKVGVGGF